MPRHLRVFPVLIVFALGASPAFAVPVTYNFEAPIFTVGQTTQLLNIAPNIGPGTFLTNFQGSPTLSGFAVTDAFPPNVLMSGQFLIDPGDVPDSLFLVFNTPVFFLQVDFAVNILPTSPPGALTLMTPVGSTSQPSSAVGGTFQGGTLMFSSAVPFMVVQLTAFNAAGAPVFFAIDDLVLDTGSVMAVPEPVTSLLVLSGLGFIARGRLRRRILP